MFKMLRDWVFGRTRPKVPPVTADEAEAKKELRELKDTIIHEADEAIQNARDLRAKLERVKRRAQASGRHPIEQLKIDMQKSGHG